MESELEWERMRRTLKAKSSSLGRPLRRERVSLVIARSVSGRERERKVFAEQCDELMRHNVNLA